MLTKNNNNKRTKGTIIFWNDEKGFGFIKPNNDKEQLFVHIKSFTNRSRRPKINQSVSYSESSDDRGRPRAINVGFIGDRAAQYTPNSQGISSFAIATCFLIIVGVSVILGILPIFILGLYVVVSLITFLWYAKDKSAAKKGAWRTPEGTLHLLSLTGGWPGALVAQQKLRHKSKKQPFRLIFWVTVMLNCGILVWLCTAEGSTTLITFITNMKLWLPL